MWIKDIKNYDVEIYKKEELIYSGNIDNASDEIKNNETETIKLEHKKLIIEIL